MPVSRARSPAPALIADADARRRSDRARRRARAAAPAARASRVRAARARSPATAAARRRPLRARAPSRRCCFSIQARSRSANAAASRFDPQRGMVTRTRAIVGDTNHVTARARMTDEDEVGVERERRLQVARLGSEARQSARLDVSTGSLPTLSVRHRRRSRVCGGCRRGSASICSALAYGIGLRCAYRRGTRRSPKRRTMRGGLDALLVILEALLGREAGHADVVGGLAVAARVAQSRRRRRDGGSPAIRALTVPAGPPLLVC